MAKKYQRKYQNWWGRPATSKEEYIEHQEDEESLIDYYNHG